MDYSDPVEDSDRETSLLLSDTDRKQAFCHNWGYLPPLDEEAVAIIDAILADPTKAEKAIRTGPDHQDFPEGLGYRNVSCDESQDIDPFMNEIKLSISGKPFPETNEEIKSYRKLWDLDQAKCNQESNEALFQRTLMMSMIARHHLLYDNETAKKCSLDFSVEEPWMCSPMPTRAYWRNERFLTVPKPDLAICFRREAVIPEDLWCNIPKATRGLACYENTGIEGTKRAFHFLTIEAKRGATSTGDTKAMLQSLNNASQGLHNMFEFFRDAEQEDTFFDKVKFFSVVASTQGLIIRIHRAIRLPSNHSGRFIIKNKPQYPLAFEFQVFSTMQRPEFKRETVFETFQKILIGYGEKVLKPLLLKAAEAIVAKLGNDEGEFEARGDSNYYRYGQTILAPKSRKQTPVPRQAPSMTNGSVDMSQDERVTRTQRQASASGQGSSLRRKRNRAQSQEPRNTRQRRGRGRQ